MLRFGAAWYDIVIVCIHL